MSDQPGASNAEQTASALSRVPEEVDREEARKEREREAARRFRRKRKEMIEALHADREGLEAQVRRLAAENEQLRQQNAQLEQARRLNEGEDQGALERERTSALEELKNLFSGLGVAPGGPAQGYEKAEERINDSKRRALFLLRRYMMEFQRALLPASQIEVTLRVLRSWAGATGDPAAEAVVGSLASSLRMTPEQTKQCQRVVAEGLTRIDAVLPRLRMLREIILELESIRPSLEKNLCTICSSTLGPLRQAMTPSQRAAFALWTESNTTPLVGRLLGDATAEFLALLPRQRELARAPMCMQQGAAAGGEQMLPALVASGAGLPPAARLSGGDAPYATPATSAALAGRPVRSPFVPGAPRGSGIPSPSPASAVSAAAALSPPQQAPSPFLPQQFTPPAEQGTSPSPKPVSLEGYSLHVDALVRDAVNRELGRMRSTALPPDNLSPGGCPGGVCGTGPADPLASWAATAPFGASSSCFAPPCFAPPAGGSAPADHVPVILSGIGVGSLGPLVGGSAPPGLPENLGTQAGMLPPDLSDLLTEAGPLGLAPPPLRMDSDGPPSSGGSTPSDLSASPHDDPLDLR
eukprot:tig00000632_g2739.t1